MWLEVFAGIILSFPKPPLKWGVKNFLTSRRLEVYNFILPCHFPTSCASALNLHLGRLSERVLELCWSIERWLNLYYMHQSRKCVIIQSHLLAHSTSRLQKQNLILRDAWIKISCVIMQGKWKQYFYHIFMSQTNKRISFLKLL